MPMSNVRVQQRRSSIIAPSTPAAPPRLVTTTTSAKRPPIAPSVEPGLKPNQPNQRIRIAEPDERHRVPGDHVRLAVGPVLAAARAEQQQRRERAGRTDQVDHRRAGEVLHPEVDRSQPPPKIQWLIDRVDQRAEDDRVDQVGAELDPLERRSPDDRQRDRAEHELEEELGRATRRRRRTTSPGRGRRSWCRGTCRASPRTSRRRRTRARSRPPSSRSPRSRSWRAPWRRPSPRSSCARSPISRSRKPGLHEHAPARRRRPPRWSRRRLLRPEGWVPRRQVLSVAAHGMRRGSAPKELSAAGVGRDHWPRVQDSVASSLSIWKGGSQTPRGIRNTLAVEGSESAARAVRAGARGGAGSCPARRRWGLAGRGPAGRVRRFRHTGGDAKLVERLLDAGCERSSGPASRRSRRAGRSSSCRCSS